MFFYWRPEFVVYEQVMDSSIMYDSKNTALPNAMFNGVFLTGISVQEVRDADSLGGSGGVIIREEFKNDAQQTQASYLRRNMTCWGG